MDITYRFLIALAARIVNIILPHLTDAIRKELIEFLNELYKKAKKTSNPMDDLFVEFIIRLLGLDDVIKVE